jgi:hypothetical protein
MEDIGTFYDHLVDFATIWYILWPFGIFYGHLVYLWSFGIFFPVLVCCSKKFLATLIHFQSSFLFAEKRVENNFTFFLFCVRKLGGALWMAASSW